MEYGVIGEGEETRCLLARHLFGIPRWTSMGVDFNRVNLLLAVLEKKAGMHLGGADVFVNVVGGIKIAEPAIDAGIVAAVVSSFRDAPIDPRTVLFGEVGLSGEVRAVAQGESRIREAAKIGFRKALVPRGNAERLGGGTGLEVVPVKNVEELIARVVR